MNLNTHIVYIYFIFIFSLLYAFKNDWSFDRCFDFPKVHLPLTMKRNSQAYLAGAISKIEGSVQQRYKRTLFPIKTKKRQI